MNNILKTLFDEEKRKRGTAQFTYKTLALAMTQFLQNAGINEEVTEQQAKYLIHGKTSLDVNRAIALANALNRQFVELIPDTLAEHSNFETELIFDSPTDVNDFFLDYDKDGRIMIYSFFPSYIYLYPLKRFRKCSEEEQITHVKRVKQFKSEKSFTTEYYDIQTILNFIFSPFYINFSREDKILILENYLSMFKPKSRKNFIYFFRNDLEYRSFSTCQLNPTKKTISMQTLLGKDYFLQIKNPNLYEKISKFFEIENIEGIDLLDHDSSIELIMQLRQLLQSPVLLECHSIINFYNNSSEKIKKMLYPNLKHLLK